MKSVGEVMAIGRTFRESLQKALRSLEIGVYGLEPVLPDPPPPPGADNSRRRAIDENLRRPNSRRLLYVGEALRSGYRIEEINGMTGIDIWFLENIRRIVEEEGDLRSRGATLRALGGGAPVPAAEADILRRAKRHGFSDRRLAAIFGMPEDDLRGLRLK